MRRNLLVLALILGLTFTAQIIPPTQAATSISRTEAKAKALEKRKAALLRRTPIRMSSSSSSVKQSSSSFSSSSAKKQSSVSSSSTSASTIPSCTLNDWTCGEWSQCEANKTQTRTCTLSRYNCKYLMSSPAPAMKQACSYFDLLPKQMKANVDKWEALHKEMVDAAKALVSQGTAGKEGIERINKVEKRLILQLDKYNKIYSEVLNLTTDLKTVWDKSAQMIEIETEMKSVDQDFRVIPTVWY